MMDEKDYGNWMKQNLFEKSIAEIESDSFGPYYDFYKTHYSLLMLKIDLRKRILKMEDISRNAENAPIEQLVTEIDALKQDILHLNEKVENLTKKMKAETL